MSGEDTGSIRIPSASDVIHDPLRRLAKLGRRYNIWGRWLVFGGIAATAFILIFSLARHDVPELMRDITIALGLGGGTLGVLLWLASVLLRSHLAHYHASKWEAEQQRVQLVADCEQFVAGLDTGMLGRLASQLEGIEAVVPALRDAVLKRIDALEAGLDERIALAVETALKQAHATGYVAGVQQRLNGAGGTLVPFPKS